ncbi:MAG TPA: hypothetical protein VFZ65_09980 [Planctomycetota bacterium]|nr:hypothetical protein [Planctomycetota bacterium]
MPKRIQIRNVPEAVHRHLKACAADAGMSLTEYLLREITRLAMLPTAAQMRERLRSRKRVKLSESAAAILRRERDSA